MEHPGRPGDSPRPSPRPRSISLQSINEEVPRWIRAQSAARSVRHPALLLLVVAPLFGEGLSGSSPPTTLLLPWHLAFMMALYGCGVLLCREIAVRWRLGFSGLCLLGVAYGVIEEGLIDRYWSDASYWHEAGIGRYGVVGHTNVLLAAHLTVFHAAVSVCCSVLVVERLAPARQGRPWVRGRALIGAAAVLASTPVLYGEFDRRPPAVDLLAAAALAGLAVVLALVAGRVNRRRPKVHDTGPAGGRRGVGLISFVAALLHWVLVYSVMDSGLPWPVGTLLALAPVVLGMAAVRALAVTGPYGADGARVIAGLVAFFVLLDLVVALNGQYDMAATAVVAVLLIRWLRRPTRVHTTRDHQAVAAPGKGPTRRKITKSGWSIRHCPRRGHVEYRQVGMSRETCLT